MASSGIKWHQVASSHIKWHQIATSSIKWHQVTSSGIKWHQVASIGFKWHQVASNGHQVASICINLHQVASSDIRWHQVASDGINWHQVASRKCVNGSRNLSKLESMTPWDMGWKSGAIDLSVDDNVEPLTHSRLSLAQKIELWGHFRRGSQLRWFFLCYSYASYTKILWADMVL